LTQQLQPVHSGWPLKRENETALCGAETRVVQWMCGMKFTNNSS